MKVLVVLACLTSVVLTYPTYGGGGGGFNQGGGGGGGGGFG